MRPPIFHQVGSCFNPRAREDATPESVRNKPPIGVSIRAPVRTRRFQHDGDIHDLRVSIRAPVRTRRERSADGGSAVPFQSARP